jgi:hypothetical protein
LAALLANTLYLDYLIFTFGITSKASQYSDIASYSLFPKVREKSSSLIDRATSHEPPPGTTKPDSKVLLTTHIESCSDLFN